MRFFKSIYWRLYIVRLSLRWILKLNLGDRVRYMGREWSLIQGVNAPYWTLFDNNAKRSHEVHEDKFRKVRSLTHAWFGFLSGYRFYMTSWYGIWMREGIKPWMIECKIWSGKPPTDHDRQHSID